MEKYQSDVLVQLERRLPDMVVLSLQIILVILAIGVCLSMDNK